MEALISEYRDKLRSISTPRKSGQAEVKVEEAEGSKVITTEHWDGRQDAAVRPATVRRQARTHRTGKQKGSIAEVQPMTKKESRRRYGDDEC